MHVLVTGGAGYIGSHTVVELLDAGHEVTVVDNLVNSSLESLKRVQEITGKDVTFVELDLCNEQKTLELFENHSFDAVIHFAGLKAVGESVAKPLLYYDNNLISTISLCKAMEATNVRQLVFSSSATVYGSPEHVPITENSAIHPTNPYGQTKAMIEQILKDLAATSSGWNITLLRYFNPIGAHESGKIGEDPEGIPNNLLPFVAQVAIGKRESLTVHGNDYDTPDGTCIRDYIHVVDLAKGHLAAIEQGKPSSEAAMYNLGTGKGSSVLEVVKAFEQASGKQIPYQIGPRRAGDIAVCYADTAKAANELKWKAEKNLEDACKDTWRWQSHNPNGYR